MKQPQISVIVPVYNVEKYIGKCLDSLINQTVQNIEIICINDGSSDGSLQTLQEYRNRDNRIKIINQENQGVSQARNHGLQQAVGSYILFVDGDDWIEPDTCEWTLRVARKYHADLVLFPYIREFEKESKPKNIFNEKMIIFDKQDVEKKLQRRMCGLYGEELRHPENGESLSPVWGKLYRRAAIREDIQFVDLKEIGTLEDGLFNLEVLENIQSAVYIRKFLYHYRKNNSSSITTGYNDKLYMQWNQLYDRMNQYISKYDKDCVFKQALSNRVALGILILGLNIVSSDLSFNQKMGDFKKILCDERYKEAYRKLEFKYFPLHWKLFYGFAKYRVVIGVYVLLIAIRKIIYG